MTFFSSRFFRLLSCALTIAAALGLAKADSTLTCRVYALDRSQGAAQAQTGQTANWKNLTVKFKSDFARYETDDGLVTVYNYAQSRAYVMDNKKKTYYIKPGDSESAFATLVQITTNLSIDPQDKTIAGNVKKIAGDDALKNLVDGRVTIAIPVSLGKTSPAPIAISGEIWTSETLGLPTKNRYLLTPLLYQAAFGGLDLQNAGQKMVAQNVIAEIRRQVETISRLPLQTNISIKNDQLDLQTKFELLSFNSDNLDDAEFKLPNDYKRVDPPDSDD